MEPVQPTELTWESGTDDGISSPVRTPSALDADEEAPEMLDWDTMIDSYYASAESTMSFANGKNGLYDIGLHSDKASLSIGNSQHGWHR